MKNLDWFQARALARRGIAVRRDAWRKWLPFNAFTLVFEELIPPASPDPEFIRIAQSISANGETPDLARFTFEAADFLALDWTTEHWITGETPPRFPATDPDPSTTGKKSGTGGSGSGTGTGSDSGSTGGDISLPPLPKSPSWGPGSSIYGGAGSGGKGSPGRTKPHAPASSAPIMTITYQTDLVNGGNACLLPSQHGSGQTCTVIMTVAIANGPSGVFGLHIQLGAESKPAESGHAGYTKDFPFTVTVNPGASLTPNVIYSATGGPFPKALPLFNFTAACNTVTFDKNASAATGSMLPQNSGIAAPLRANAFALAGYTFREWDTAPEGGEAAYAEEEVFAFDAPLDLYAQWDEGPPPSPTPTP